MAVTAITAFRSSDGTIFTAEAEANAHEFEILLCAQLSKIEDSPANSPTQRKHMANLLLRNADKLLPCLQAYYGLGLSDHRSTSEEPGE